MCGVVRCNLFLCRSGTATNDLAPAIKLYKHGQVYKCDKNGFINCGIGKVHHSTCRE